VFVGRSDTVGLETKDVSENINARGTENVRTDFERSTHLFLVHIYAAKCIS
jgi:hypothetical protein